MGLSYPHKMDDGCDLGQHPTCAPDTQLLLLVLQALELAPAPPSGPHGNTGAAAPTTAGTSSDSSAAAAEAEAAGPGAGDVGGAPAATEKAPPSGAAELQLPQQQRPPGSSLAPTHEAAHNLVLMYRASGADELARRVMRRYLVI